MRRWRSLLSAAVQHAVSHTALGRACTVPGPIAQQDTDMLLMQRGTKNLKNRLWYTIALAVTRILPNICQRHVVHHMVARQYMVIIPPDQKHVRHIFCIRKGLSMYCGATWPWYTIAVVCHSTLYYNRGLLGKKLEILAQIYVAPWALP